MIYRIYRLLAALLVVVGFPVFWVYSRMTGRYWHHLHERLGIVPRGVIRHLKGHPRIWIHAVSLGEVKVAEAVVPALQSLLPKASIIVSTTTEHGRKLAEETFQGSIPVIYAPIDFSVSVQKALSSVKPDMMVFLETEIWPAWIIEAHRRGIRTGLINGRISVRSLGGYLKLSPLFKEVLSHFDVFSMILEEDAARIQAMGADPEKIRINGNAKYDLLSASVHPEMETQTRRILNLDSNSRVLVGGSTREGEEAMLLDAYEKILRVFPDTMLIIAPRHIERTPEIGRLIETRGYHYQLRTDLDKAHALRKEKILLMNTFGELFKVYSVGTIVFCGASLVPLGGQNPLEPAAWGRIVLYGPSMEDFLDAKALLEGVGAGVPVWDSDSLAERVIWFLSHPQERRRLGDLAKQAVMKNQGAAEKHARVIAELLIN